MSTEPTLRITTAWVESEVDGEMPWLVAAYDEFTEDGWNGTPDFFTEAVEKYAPNVRILNINVPHAAVENLFTPATTEGHPTLNNQENPR